MATLVDLAAKGHIHHVDGVDAGQCELRSLYASPQLIKWFEMRLPALEARDGRQITPQEQVGDLIQRFCAGERLRHPSHFNQLDYDAAHGLWKLKTLDVRIFGWFARIDCFVGVCANSAEAVKSIPGLYHGHAGEVRRFQADLDLDPPKHVPGDDPNAVVSNFAS